MLANNRFRKIAPIFAIHTTNANQRRRGHTLQAMLAVIFILNQTRLLIQLTENLTTPTFSENAYIIYALQAIGLIILILTSYALIRHALLEVSLHFIFITLLTGEILTIFNIFTSGNTTYNNFIFLYLICLVATLPLRQSFPYIIVISASAYLLHLQGLSYLRYLLLVWSFAAIGRIVRVAYRDAILKANEYAHQTAQLNKSLQERINEQTHDLRRRNRYLNASLTIRQALANPFATDDLFQQITSSLQQTFALNSVALFLYKPNQQLIQLHHRLPHIPTSTENPQPIQLNIADTAESPTFVQQVAQQQYAHLIRPYQQKYNHAQPYPIPPAIRAQLILPLIARNKLIGVLDLQSQDPEAFNADEVQILQVTADQIAHSINNTLLFNELQTNTANLAELQNITSLMSQQVNTLNALNVMAQRARTLVSATAVAVYLWQPTQQNLEIVIQNGFGDTNIKGRTLLLNEGLAGRVFNTGQPDTINNYAEWEGRASHFGDIGLASLLAVPIKERERKIGVLVLANLQQNHPFSPEDTQIIALLASQAGTIITNHQLIEETQAIAQREKLVNQITAEVRNSLDTETILERLVQELGQTLNQPQLSVTLYPTNTPTPKKPHPTS